jgi:hypothetical protein
VCVRVRVYACVRMVRDVRELSVLSSVCELFVHFVGMLLTSRPPAPPPPIPTSCPGAYYDFYAYEPDITSKGVPQDILAALARTFVNGTYFATIPRVHAFMLDAYWMFNDRPNGNCKYNDSVWPVPFPLGLTALAGMLNAVRRTSL